MFSKSRWRMHLNNVSIVQNVLNYSCDDKYRLTLPVSFIESPVSSISNNFRFRYNLPGSSQTIYK